MGSGLEWFTEFPVNVVKSTSARLEDLGRTEGKSMGETFDLPVPRPPSFKNTLTLPERSIV